MRVSYRMYNLHLYAHTQHPHFKECSKCWVLWLDAGKELADQRQSEHVDLSLFLTYNAKFT